MQARLPLSNNDSLLSVCARCEWLNDTQSEIMKDDFVLKVTGWIHQRCCIPAEYTSPLKKNTTQTALQQNNSDCSVPTKQEDNSQRFSDLFKDTGKLF